MGFILGYSKVTSLYVRRKILLVCCARTLFLSNKSCFQAKLDEFGFSELDGIENSQEAKLHWKEAKDGVQIRKVRRI